MPHLNWTQFYRLSACCPLPCDDHEFSSMYNRSMLSTKSFYYVRKTYTAYMFCFYLNITIWFGIKPDRPTHFAILLMSWYNPFGNVICTLFGNPIISTSLSLSLVCVSLMAYMRSVVDIPTTMWFSALYPPDFLRNRYVDSNWLGSRDTYLVVYHRQPGW